MLEEAYRSPLGGKTLDLGHRPRQLVGEPLVRPRLERVRQTAVVPERSIRAAGEAFPNRIANLPEIRQDRPGVVKLVGAGN